jgi:hypothetical protein
VYEVGHGKPQTAVRNVEDLERPHPRENKEFKNSLHHRKWKRNPGTVDLLFNTPIKVPINGTKRCVPGVTKENLEKICRVAKWPCGTCGRRIIEGTGTFLNGISFFVGWACGKMLDVG